MSYNLEISSKILPLENLKTIFIIFMEMARNRSHAPVPKIEKKINIFKMYFGQYLARHLR